MGGKTLKFPKRKKYIPPIEKNENIKEEDISKEEHQARLNKLKEIGLLK